jgi:hypothetical protein
LVREISVAVDRRISPTEATWQQIRDQLSSTALANVRATAAPSAATPPPASGPTPAIQSGALGAQEPPKYDARGEVSALATAAQALAQSTAMARAYLLSVDAREADVATDSCVVGPAHDMRLINKTNPDRLERNKSISFAVFDRGGEGRGGVPRVPDPGDGVTSEVIAKGGANYAIKFTADANAPLGARVAVIQSGNGFEQIEIGFNVVEPAAPPAQATTVTAPIVQTPPPIPPTPPIPAPPQPVTGKPLWLNETRELVLGYGAKAAGPNDWRKIAEAYAAEHKVSPVWDASDAATPTAPLRKVMDDAAKLAANSNAQGGGPLDPFELWWVEAHATVAGQEPRVIRLQKKLGASGPQVTGVLDAATRKLIKAQNSGNEHLTAAFVKQLLGS